MDVFNESINAVACGSVQMVVMRGGVGVKTESGEGVAEGIKIGVGAAVCVEVGSEEPTKEQLVRNRSPPSKIKFLFITVSA
jgi:hypothetical protein